MLILYSGAPSYNYFFIIRLKGGREIRTIVLMFLIKRDMYSMNMNTACVCILISLTWKLLCSEGVLGCANIMRSLLPLCGRIAAWRRRRTQCATACVC